MRYASTVMAVLALLRCRDAVADQWRGAAGVARRARRPSSTAPRTRLALASIALVLLAAPIGCDDRERFVGGSSHPVDPTAVVLPELVVEAVSPDSGPLGGNAAVTITGIGFQPGARVTFGSVAAAYVSVAGSTVIHAVTPRQTEQGAVDVTVRNPNGRASILVRRYRYGPADSSDGCAGCWDY